MKYYSIAQSTEIIDVGFYPQTRIRNEFDSGSFDSFLNVKANEFPDFTPKYELRLDSKAIRTDMIDRGPLIFGRVISGKFRNILEKMNLPPHRFYDVNVYHDEGILKYYWFHYTTNIWDFVDISKSIIQIFNIRTQAIIDEPNFKSVEQIKIVKKLLKHSTAMRFEHVTIKSNFPSYDFFEMTDVQYFDLVSENLKNFIYKEGITGCIIREYDKVKFQ